MPEPTKIRLANLLRSEGLIPLADRAERGDFDDYESESATPSIDLVRALHSAGSQDLAERAADGEWDGTKEESKEWFRREGQYLIGHDNA